MDTSSSPGLRKARQLAKNNPQLARKLDPDKKPHSKIKARQKRLKQASAQIQKFYGEEIPKSSILLVKPDSKDPLSIPLSRQKQLLEEKNYKEVEKMAISDLKNALNTDFSQNNQQTENHQNENVENTSVYAAEITFDEYKVMEEMGEADITFSEFTTEQDIKTMARLFPLPKNSKLEILGSEDQDISTIPQTFPQSHDQQNNPQTQTPQTEGATDSVEKLSVIETSTSTTIGESNNGNVVRAEEKVSTMTDTREKLSPIGACQGNQGSEKPKRKRGRPRKEEKLSQGIFPISSPIDIPEDYSVIPLKVKNTPPFGGIGKTSLTYLSIYSNSLTPEMLDKILQADESELPLTIAEIAALRLLKKTMQDDEKSTKLYWDLQKTLEKNKKPQQIRKNETTLLQQKLAEAKTAILSEKPVDGNSDPV